MDQRDERSKAVAASLCHRTPKTGCGVAVDFASIAKRPNRCYARNLITNTNTEKPRLAASSYLNSAPLIWSFQHGTRREVVQLLTDAAPARCADLLSSRQVEAALVPVIEYQRIPDVRVVQGVCVGSHATVRSVVLISKESELKKVRRVALDVSSRTSQALVKIIFREFLGFEPEWRPSRPDLQAMLENNDAALLIGDPGMKILPQELHVFDLASLWHSFTDTGFVFAMWMVHSDAVATSSKVDFGGARDEGLAQIETIIDQYENEVTLSREEMRRYLTENITFQIDENLEKGMRLYFELAAKHRLVENNKPLQFIGS